AGELGIPGVTVRLTPSTNVTIDGVVYGPNVGATFPYLETVTDSEGEYLFIGLPHGVDYTAQVIPPAAGFTQTGDPNHPNVDCRVAPNICDNSYTVTNLQANFLDADFGYIIPNIIAGTVWFDANANAQIDGESPLAGWEVRLTGPSCVAAPGYCVTFANADGLYVFYAATDGDYTVTVIPPAGYTQTAESANGTPADVQTCTALGGCNNQVASISVAGGNVYAGYDFGYRGEYAIEGFVYADWDSDASFNSTDVGWEGIPVILYDENGQIIATTTTDSDGKYTFEHLPPGDYVVKVDQTALPPQYSQTENYGEDDGNGFCTTCASQASVTITSEPVTDVNFGYEPVGTGSIGDFVWYDNNGNAIPNAGEPGLDGITVELYVDYGDGYVLVSTTTTVNGAYSFSNLPPGDYRVQLDPTTIGDLQYTTASSFDVTLIGGQTYLDADFGLANGGIIGDTIYWDANGNAEQDWNELGIPGVTVSLQISNTLTNSWEPYGVPQVTDASGNYLFTGLPAGQYRVVVDTNSAPIVDRELTGDPDTNGIPCYPTPDAFWVPFCDSAHSVEMRLGQTYLGADFGYQPTGVIGDFIWLDSSNFGVQDSGEPGLVDVRVWLCNGTPCDATTAVMTTTTDFSGYYSFVNVGAGTWTVQVDSSTLPAGVIPTYDLDGTGTLHVTSITLDSAGDSNFNVDFGYRYNGSRRLSGSVFYDVLRNENGGQTGGDRETGEPGYEGQTVFLWQLVGSSYVLVGSTTTDADGDYSFTNLPAGNYVVSTNATSPILNNAAHTSTPTQNDDTAWESVEIVDQDIADVDFGFFIGTDFDDLPDSYQTTLSAGPYHINSGEAGTLRLGSTIDLEPNGLPGAAANGDGASDDGVQRNMSSRWTPGATIELLIEVSGGPGVVGGWFDWNNDDAFGPGEFVNFGELESGTRSLPVNIPDSYTTGQVLFARFRVFDPANIPGGSLSANDFQGGATGGEVEGYRWQFTPTAVSLSSFSGGNSAITFLVLAAVGVLLAACSLLVARRRQ
ncbi:MAG: SdrD B-like domain-containing protein, partial [Chloroflexota bacterium]